MKSWRNTQNYCKQLQTGVNEYEREREREREKILLHIFKKYEISYKKVKHSKKEYFLILVY